jgi:hypothetical protein
LLRRLLRNQSIGTMLPFKGEHGWNDELAPLAPVVDYCHTEIVDHEAVKGWRLRADGSVRISCAGILATSCTQMDREIPAVLQWDGSSQYIQVLDFWTQLNKMAGKHIIYAVALYKDRQMQHGILL